MTIVQITINVTKFNCTLTINEYDRKHNSYD